MGVSGCWFASRGELAAQAGLADDEVLGEEAGGEKEGEEDRGGLHCWGGGDGGTVCEVGRRKRSSSRGGGGLAPFPLHSLAGSQPCRAIIQPPTGAFDASRAEGENATGPCDLLDAGGGNQVDLASRLFALIPLASSLTDRNLRVSMASIEIRCLCSLCRGLNLPELPTGSWPATGQ